MIMDRFHLFNPFKVSETKTVAVAEFVQFDDRFLSWSDETGPTRIDMSRAEALMKSPYGRGFRVVIEGQGYYPPENLGFEALDHYWALSQCRKPSPFDVGQDGDR
jgi:hypothetical protein